MTQFKILTRRPVEITSTQHVNLDFIVAVSNHVNSIDNGRLANDGK